MLRYMSVRDIPTERVYRLSDAVGILTMTSWHQPLAPATPPDPPMYCPAAPALAFFSINLPHSFDLLSEPLTQTIINYFNHDVDTTIANSTKAK